MSTYLLQYSLSDRCFTDLTQHHFLFALINLCEILTSLDGECEYCHVPEFDTV